VTAQATNEPPAPEDDGILRIGDTPEEPKWDVLFSLRGQECKGLANPPASLMLRYVNTLRKRGANVAISWLLEEMLTPEACEALEDPAVSRPDFRKVTDLLLGLLFGGDVPKSRQSG
jgi:hypothetical protein